jgi:hypothetical protein
MLAGICPKCGAFYSGWALKSPWYQICDRCGTDIEIKDIQYDNLNRALQAGNWKDTILS